MAVYQPGARWLWQEAASISHLPSQTRGGTRCFHQKYINFSLWWKAWEFQLALSLRWCVSWEKRTSARIRDEEKCNPLLMTSSTHSFTTVYSWCWYLQHRCKPSTWSIDDITSTRNNTEHINIPEANTVHLPAMNLPKQHVFLLARDATTTSSDELSEEQDKETIAHLSCHHGWLESIE